MVTVLTAPAAPAGPVPVPEAGRADLRRPRGDRAHLRRAGRRRDRHRVPDPGAGPADRAGRPGHHRPGPHRHRQDPGLRHPADRSGSSRPGAGRRRRRAPWSSCRPGSWPSRSPRTCGSPGPASGRQRGDAVRRPRLRAADRGAGHRSTSWSAPRAGCSTWSGRVTWTCPRPARWCSTRPTRCSTSASCRTSRGSCGSPRRTGRPCCSRPPCPARWSRWPGGTCARPTHVRAEQHDEPAHVPTTEQHVFRAHQMDKIEVLARVLQAEGRGLTIVFCRTKRSADQVAERADHARLRRRGGARRPGPGPARAGHAGVPQRQGRRAGGHRRGRPRPGRRRRHARGQLRVPRGRQGLPAPDRPDRPGRARRRGRHLRGLGTTCSAGS